MRTKEEILERVEHKEFEERCLAVNVCPKCGDDLELEIDDTGGVDKTCNRCEMTYWT